ncbi:hypothetical protein SLS62_006651 [Diatrype stigma]|uniref:Uncharacterized protein n=1 Tax=Diatrype stigma TaxID=117547 RepID=A0AAN9UMV5_9PEZI
MATEATAAKPVDVSVNGPSLTHPASTTKPDAHHANSSAPAVNGSSEEIEHKQISDIVDELVNSAEVSVSGGSDTEASKADPSHRFADGKGHVRTSSSAKPKSFKAVSVNKTFLASKGPANATTRPDSTAGSASSTPGPGTPGSSASRLKLVAKSGSNLGGSTKTLSTNGKSGAAPDGSSVWNRNKPAPGPPEPKKLSDEEIMNQFNIHIADRLRPEDDAKGQANWADIEDDEEWAPETITWTDGTQITLPHVDEHTTSPAPAPATLSKQPQPEAQPTKPKSPAPTVPPPATSASASPSVKPGVLASGKGLVLKGAPEKPTLVAKPPAPPAPVKSPWAPLPPIDKASPAVVMELPAQAYPPRGPPRDAVPRDAVSTKGTTPPPAKEIAADDFSRAPWREGPANSNRELFNSQSGRYEPVLDRRGSRNDISGRQPSLLQRPHHDYQGPPEPSAAFQTSRTSGQEGPYGRRRGSSVVSGGSGSVAHRLGRAHDIPPPPEGLRVRTGSIAGATDNSMPNHTFSPANNHPTPRMHHGQPWQAQPSPNQAYANLHHPQPAPETSAVVSPVPSMAMPTDDETIQLQKKIMRERREAAMKRRLEEEEREEAAKKERLRLKLEALGPAPERKSSKKEEHKEETPKVYQPPQREGAPGSLASRAANASQKSDAPTTASVEKDRDANTDANPTAETQLNGDIQGSSFSQSRSQGLTSHTSTLPKSQPPTSWHEASQPQKHSPYWGNGPQPTLRNVWGAPGNDRSLGNGTFSADLGPLSDSQPAPMPAAPRHPAPIGTPRNVSQAHHAHAEPPSSRLAPIGPPRGRPASSAQGQQQKPSNPWQTVDVAADDRAIALELRARREAQDVDTMGPSRTIDTWRETTRADDGRRVAVGNSVKTLAGVDKGDQRNASWNNVPGGNIRDHQSATSERKDASHQLNGAGPDYGRQTILRPTGVAASASTSQARSGSRFFPSSRTAQQEDSTSQQSRGLSPSPPPPTMEDHPVYSGNPERPHVALPPPKPHVKLPPSMAASEPPAPNAQPQKTAPISFAAAAATPPPQATSARPPSRGPHNHSQRPHEYASQQKWQDKINHLMGKETALPGRSMAVEVASRQNLEHTHLNANGYATVSLPSLSLFGLNVTDTEFTTKRMAEECFEEQEMGSLPPVHLPNDAPDALWHASSVNWHPLSRALRVEASNADELRFGPDWVNGRTVIRVATPGSESRTLPYNLRGSLSNRTRSNPQRSAQRGGGGGGGGGGGRHPSRAGHRGGREVSSDRHGDRLSGPSERPASNRSNGRSSFRGRSENWGRHASSASTVQT